MRSDGSDEESAHRDSANASVLGETWTGADTTAEPDRPQPGTRPSVQDQIALSAQEHKEHQEVADQQQRHRMQLWVAGGAATFVLVMFALTLAFAAAHVLDGPTVQDILHTIIGPMVVSGLIAIIAWLFSSSRSG